MSKYYNKEIPDEINVVYGYRYSGKIYNENKKLEERIKELEEKNKTFEDYNKDLNNQLDKLEEENKRLKEDYDILDKFDDKNINDYKKLEEENNDLRRIYKNTYNRLFQNGNDELARYFQAQIDDCPTFYVEPIIDYAKEWKEYKSRIDKAIKHIEENTENINRDTYYEDYVETYDLLKILKGEE